MLSSSRSVRVAGAIALPFAILTLHPAAWSLANAPNAPAGRDAYVRQRSAAVRRQFMREYRLRCVPRGAQIDHVVPLECGGPDVVANLCLRCGAENAAKEHLEHGPRLTRCGDVARFVSTHSCTGISPSCTPLEAQRCTSGAVPVLALETPREQVNDMQDMVDGAPCPQAPELWCSRTFNTVDLNAETKALLASCAGVEERVTALERRLDKRKPRKGR